MKDSNFIRSEFEFFVRIGNNPLTRRHARRLIRFYLQHEELFTEPPVVYIEVRNSKGGIAEMWLVSTERAQLLRLFDFLQRFTVEDVQMMESLLGR